MEYQEFFDAILPLEVWDTHTHLRGAALAARSFWDVGHYFWFLRELLAAGYPAGYRSLSEDERIAAYVRAYHATRNTSMHWVVERIFRDLYGLEITGEASVRAADEVRQLAVDGDLRQGQPRPERPGEVKRGGKALPEQVDLARARQAPAGCRCAHGDDLAGHVDGLYRRRLDRDRDRDHRDHQEGHGLRGPPEQPLPPARRFRLGHGVLMKGTWQCGR